MEEACSALAVKPPALFSTKAGPAFYQALVQVGGIGQGIRRRASGAGIRCRDQVRAGRYAAGAGGARGQEGGRDGRKGREEWSVENVYRGGPVPERRWEAPHPRNGGLCGALGPDGRGPPCAQLRIRPRQSR